MCFSSSSMMTLLPIVSSACRHTWGTLARPQTCTHTCRSTHMCEHACRALMHGCHQRQQPAAAALSVQPFFFLEKGTTLALNKDKLVLESVDVSSHADTAKVFLIFIYPARQQPECVEARFSGFKPSSRNLNPKMRFSPGRLSPKRARVLSAKTAAALLRPGTFKTTFKTRLPNDCLVRAGLANHCRG